MRQTRDAQTHLYNFYADHPIAQQPRELSERLDRQPFILSLLDGEPICPQATIRRIFPQTLAQINRQWILHGAHEKPLSLDSMRIDSTLVGSNILEPRDSQCF